MITTILLECRLELLNNYNRIYNNVDYNYYIM